MTADLMDPNVNVQMDICNIQFPDGSFDVIYCSHVLEHVPDPDQALHEFFRILNDHGWAVIAVPVSGETTIGDPSITNSRERERLFGQHDHFWRFGEDFVERIRNAGFQVEILRPNLIADEGECRFMALPKREPIYFCTKSTVH